MKKLLLASLIGTLCATMALVTTDAAAQTSQSAVKKPAPKHHIVKRKSKAAPEKAEPIEEGSIEWSCADSQHFEVKGDMKRDQIVTMHWGTKNYKLPRENTSTGADRFHDAATGMDLVVIPTKAMLFSDKDSARLADECKTAAMDQGAAAPTQSNAIQKSN